MKTTDVVDELCIYSVQWRHRRGLQRLDPGRNPQWQRQPNGNLRREDSRQKETGGLESTNTFNKTGVRFTICKLAKRTCLANFHFLCASIRSSLTASAMHIF